MANVFLVIGNGWSALSAVGTAVRLGGRVQWILGSGTRLISPLPATPAGASAQEWAELAATVGIPLGAPAEGFYTREFRNKAFREPKWVAAPGTDRIEALPEEMLWPVEARFAAPWEARFERDLFELEEEIRANLTQSPQVRVIAENPATRVDFESEGRIAVELGSGEVIKGDTLIFADRLTGIRAISGMPATLEIEGKKTKVIDLLRKWDTTGVLQVVFSHGRPIGEAVEEGFYTVLQKEAGQEEERHVWGYFSGHSSVWTTGLSPEENEDNHQIAKRLRRIKQALGRTFDDPQWKGEAREFLDTVTDESVRFLESFLFIEGKALRSPMTSPSHERFFVLTDGFGAGPAMEQAKAMAEALGREPMVSFEPESTAEESKASSASVSGESEPQEGSESKTQAEERSIEAAEEDSAPAGDSSVRPPEAGL